MDRFLAPDGSFVHPYVLVRTLLAEAPWLRRFQIVQERVELIHMKLVPIMARSPSPREVVRIADVLGKTLENGIRVQIELVDEIPAGANGKFQPYLCLCRRTKRGSDSALDAGGDLRKLRAATHTRRDRADKR